MTRSYNALSLTPAVNGWLANSHHPRVLHVFDRACNLINERGEVVSIVTPQIGNGPFNLVVETDFLFVEHLSIKLAVSVSSNHLALGNLNIFTAKATLWNPRPDWETLHSERDNIETAAPLTTSLSAAWLKSAGRGEAGILWHEFFAALVSGDEIEIQKTMKTILAVGETSGADALVGFIGVFTARDPRGG